MAWRPYAMTWRWMGAVATACAISTPAWAQTPPVPAVSEQVVVTASRLQELAKDVSVTVTVITRDDIARSSARTVDDVLRMVPGFTTLRVGSSMLGHPTVRSVSLRGLGGGSSRTLVLLDGIPMNDPVTAVVFWPRIPLENVERIEVVKSGASGVWGNLAMGGVINIISKTPKDGKTAFAARAQGGTQDTGETYVRAQKMLGAVGISASATYLTTGGYFATRDDQIGSIDRKLTNNVMTGDVQLHVRSQSRGTWTVAGSLYGEDQGYGTPLSRDGSGAGYIRGAGDIVTQGGSHWQVATFLTRQRFHSFNPTVAADHQSETPSSNQFLVPGSAIGSSVQWTRPFARGHVINVGADATWTSAGVNEDFSYSAATARFTRLRTIDGRMAFGGVFAEDLYQVNSRWRIVGAARVDLWQTIDGTRRETDQATGAVLRDDVYANHRAVTLNPSVSTIVKISNRVAVRSGIYRAFRAPTTGELYRPFRARGNAITESNAALNPERLVGTEAGVDATLTSRVHARLTGFWNVVDQPVITVTLETVGATAKVIAPCGSVPAFGSCRQRLNAGSLRTGGIETALEFVPVERLMLSVSYLYNKSQVTEAPDSLQQLVGKFTRQAPVHTGVIQAAFDDPRLARVAAQLRVVGRRYEDDVNTIAIAPFVSVDLNVSRTLSSKTEAFVTVQNLLDRTNELTHTEDGTYSIAGPRQISAGLKLRF